MSSSIGGRRGSSRRRGKRVGRGRLEHGVADLGVVTGLGGEIGGRPERIAMMVVGDGGGEFGRRGGIEDLVVEDTDFVFFGEGRGGLMVEIEGWLMLIAGHNNNSGVRGIYRWGVELSLSRWQRDEETTTAI